MNEKYWEKFYKKFKCKKASDFAKFCNKRIGEKKYIIDAGCGNRRDTRYFHKKGHYVEGVDKIFGEDVLEYLKEDMTMLKPIIYARFLLHAMKRKEMIEFLTICKNKGYAVYAEARSDKDKNIRKDKSHKRNLVNSQALLRFLLEIGYKLRYFEEGRGLARWKNEDPIVIRFIVE